MLISPYFTVTESVGAFERPKGCQGLGRPSVQALYWYAPAEQSAQRLRPASDADGRSFRRLRVQGGRTWVLCSVHLA